MELNSKGQMDSKMWLAKYQMFTCYIVMACCLMVFKISNASLNITYIYL